MRKLLLLCWIVAAVSVTGCGSKSSESALTTDVDTTQYDQVDADAALREEARRMVKDVFFEFDSAELDQMAMSQLKNNAAWLVNNQSISVMIEGHCDARGTYEYNMALGERRAEVTKGFLKGPVSMGQDLKP
ncbi:OmpA family protein [Prosthecochloris sp. SCSIO W1101]|uniref:OmpA family protein n=1 Tax=Prosthecochloris sp. SCSIO W1101 TaxID=2992242 RepID=UPI002AC88C91|nr:OmpA family protein [Prosthecochloris sp. SCSIO W1101]